MTRPEPPVARRRRVRVWAVAAVTVIALAAVTAFVRYGSQAAERPRPKHIPGTAVVERRTLKEIVTAPGTLAYQDAGKLAAGRSGTVTRLPRTGARIKPGGTLYAIDNQPVVLLRGRLPAWRTFTGGMSDGPDVRQLEDNLAALGHLTVTPDDHFDWFTIVAIQNWQHDRGVPQTRTVTRGQILFAPGQVRVARITARLGDRVAPGAAIAELSALDRTVVADLKAADQNVARKRGEVTVNLPAGETTTGTVTAVGAPRRREDSGGGKTVVVPVTITLDHPRAAGSLEQIAVFVDFPTATRENVLTVPVTALVALPGGGYGVEVVRGAGETRTLTVTPGLFAAGSVEVTGQGLRAGQKVVVPTL